MKARILCTLLLAFGLPLEGALAAAYIDKRITALQMSLGDCIYFQLEGVTQVDPPTLAGWFAVPLGTMGAKEIVATLLSARLSDTPVDVVTTGHQVCGGYAQATNVTI